MRRGVLTSARLLVEQAHAGGFQCRTALVTVTYRPGVEPQPRHLSALQTHYRNWLGRRGHVLRCIWVAEQHKSGRVHYHLVMLLPKGLTPPLPDKQGWWPHGMSNAKWLPRKAVGYLAKYCSKGGEVRPFPPGLRLWGVAGLRGHWRDQLRWWLAPAWLQELVPLGDALRRAGCWWENRTNGIAYRSPYELLDFYGGRLQFFGPVWTEDHVRFL